MADNKPNIDDFLRKIAQVESSGGTNFNHPQIKSGLQKGQTAIGTYGLLPNTVDEVVARSKDPALKELSDMSPQEQKTYLESNPDKEQLVAQHLAEHVLAKQDGDEEKAAFAWNQGHNLSPDAVEKRNYQDSDYVQKFNKLSNTIKPVTKSEPATKVPGQASPPLDIGGTPEGDKLQESLEYSPSQQVRDLIGKQRDDLSKAMEIASRGPFQDKTPEERDFEEAHLDPLTRGLAQGVPVAGVAAKVFPEVKPAAVGAFNRVKNYITNKATPMTAAEFMLKQSKNPDVMEVLKDIRQYAPDVAPNPSRIQGIENAVESQAAQDANQSAINNSDNIDLDTLKTKLRGN